VGMLHNFTVTVGDQVYVDSNLEEVGAVRQVARDHLVIYIENAGDFRIDGPAVKSAHDGKVVLDGTKLDPNLTDALKTAHANEDS
jgi:hypothetical protein